MTESTQTALSGGRYKLLSELGEGGMATVFHAYDSVLDVDRAIKVLATKLAASNKVRERFVNEARTMARLQHRHIVSVFDVAADGDRVFMVMELVTGGSLVDRVKRAGPLPPRMAAEVVLDVLSGLAVAHDAGIVHRDIKPHNILITPEGDAKVTDFGIARVNQGDSSKTKTGAVLGTWAYMAPEQRKSSNKADARSDIYAVGATLYSLVTGAEPFDLYSSELHAELFDTVDPVLSRIIQKASRYKPDDRYQNAAEMAEAIREDLERLPEVSVSVAPLVDLKALTDAFSRDDTAPRPVHEVASATTGGDPKKTDETFMFESGVSKVPREVLAAAGKARSGDSEDSDVVGIPTATSTAGVTGEHVVRAASGGAAVLGAALVATGLLLVVAASIVALAVFYSPPSPGPVEPVTVDGPDPVEPDPLEPDPMEIDPIGLDPVEADPAEPDPVEPDPVEPDPVEPDPVEPDPVQADPVASPPDPPKAKPQGKLLVNALPGGQLELEGKGRGSTPWSADLPPGKYSVRIEHDGAEVERVIKVTDGGTAAFCWDFDLEAPC